MTRRPSRQTVAVLEALLHRPSHWHHGYELVSELGIASGTLYPILMRLHDREVLETRWEDPIEGRPPRHLYRLTPGGKKWASAVLAEAPSSSSLPELGTA